MKEILALHEKILALPDDVGPVNPVNFSRAAEDSEFVDLLPEDLQSEVAALREAINVTLPEDFDYFVFVGNLEEGPIFSLQYERMLADSSEKGTFQPDRSLVEQLKELDWDDQRAKAKAFGQTLEDIVNMTKRLSGPLRPTKSIQRDFRESARDFIKEKRADTRRIFLLYWDQEERLMESKFDDGDGLRDVLPSLVARGVEVITVVAWGKPLTAERIDALLVQAQATLRERIAARTAEAEKKAANDEKTGETVGHKANSIASPLPE